MLIWIRKWFPTNFWWNVFGNTKWWIDSNKKIDLERIHFKKILVWGLKLGFHEYSFYMKGFNHSVWFQNVERNKTDGFLFVHLAKCIVLIFFRKEEHHLDLRHHTIRKCVCINVLFVNNWGTVDFTYIWIEITSPKGSVSGGLFDLANQYNIRVYFWLAHTTKRLLDIK